jgi:hypothetical protein|tara:strand:- start:1177 stop:2910 length:1734 start_codon:yes stop_codon:yes gene_type:complete
MTELPKTGNRRVDLAMQLIFDTTGMDPQKFLNFLGKSNKKVKLQASTNEEISEALRMLSTPKKDKAEYIKSVFQDPDQRKNRSILINYYKNDKGLIDFTKQIKKEFLQPKKTTFVPASNQYGVVGSKMIPVKTSQLEPETVQKFAKLFNLNNPFITRTLKENLTAAEYRSVRETSELRKLLDPVAIKTQKKISGSVTNFPFDLIVDRAEQVLRTYKKLIPEATGRELKLAPGMFGEIDINAVFQTDPVLAEFIKIGARQQSKGTQRDIQRGLGINQGAVRKIMNQLNREGTIKELGLDQYYFLGGNPKPVKIADPDVKKFMEDEAKSVGYSLKMRDLTGILDPDQLAYISDVRKNINDIVKPLSTKPKMTEFVTTRKTFYKSVDDIITANLKRMLQFGIRQGKTKKEIMDSFKDQTSDPAFYNEVVPLLFRKVKKQDEISYYNKKYGLSIDDLHFSHKTRVVDDIDLTFRIFNVFNGKASKNKETERLQKKIANLKVILNQKGGRKLAFNEEVEKRLEREIKDLEFELENGGYFDSDELEYESLTPENIAQIVTAQGQMFKDGGFASIEDVLDYNNG